MFELINTVQNKLRIKYNATLIRVIGRFVWKGFSLATGMHLRTVDLQDSPQVRGAKVERVMTESHQRRECCCDTGCLVGNGLQRAVNK